MFFLFRSRIPGSENMSLVTNDMKAHLVIALENLTIALRVLIQSPELAGNALNFEAPQWPQLPLLALHHLSSTK